MNQTLKITLISIIFHLLLISYPSFSTDTSIDMEQVSDTPDRKKRRNKIPELFISEPFTPEQNTPQSLPPQHMIVDITLPLNDNHKRTLLLGTPPSGTPRTFRENWEQRYIKYQIVTGTILETMAMPCRSLVLVFGLVSTVGASVTLALEDSNPNRGTFGIVTLVGTIGVQVCSMIGDWAQKEADQRLAIEYQKNKMISESLKIHFQGNIIPQEPVNQT